MLLRILLQTPLPTLQQGNTTSTIIAVGVFGLFILFLIIAGASGNNRSGTSGTYTQRNKKFNKRKFRHHATSRGLSRGEIQLLENMVRRFRIQSPFALLNNGAILDSTLKKSLKEVEESPMDPDEREAQKLTLYRIKQKIERSTRGVKAPDSSRQLKMGQTLSIAVNDVRYQCKITSNLQKSFGVTVPKDRSGTEIRWKKWTKVEVFFWRSNGQSFSFSTKILGYNMIRGIPSIFLQHTNSIKEARQRRYRRKSMERPAYFYPIRIVSTGLGKNSTRKAIVDSTRGTLATILDISAGGCSLRSSYPLGRSELMKMEFETSQQQKVTVFGKVVGMDKMSPPGGIMHVMFTRISRSNMNRINSYIYSFEQHQERRIPRL